MDYYQKYQKYKFKYLNLLNQFGGGYTVQEFKELLKKTPDEKEIEGSICPITYFPVLKENAVLINNEIYDAIYLFKYILFFSKDSDDPSKLPLIPHNRNRFKIEMLFDIYDKGKKKYDEKEKIYFKIIILRCILVIELTKKLAIVQTGIRLPIQVLTTSAEKSANNIINKHKNISEKEMIKNVLNNYNFLAFLSDDIIKKNKITEVEVKDKNYKRFIPN